VLITSGYMEVDSSFPAIRKKGYQFLQKPYEIPDLLRSGEAGSARSYKMPDAHLPGHPD
jgi:hypothetical protein